MDFTNNLEIERDRLREPVQHIVDFDGDAIEWKADTCNGVTNKNWPVAYPRFREVALDIDLCVHLEGLESVTADVRDSARMAGTDLLFEKSGVTLVDGVNHISGFVSQRPRWQSVTFDEPMSIRWQVSGDFGTLNAGTSTHNTYITLRDPVANPQTGTPFRMYFTLVHWTTHVANGSGSDTPLVRRVEDDLEGRSVYRRDFNPVSGAIIPRQALLQYWNDVSPGQPLDVLLEHRRRVFSCGLYFTTEALLETTQGRCGAWAEFMVHALGINGISAQTVHLVVGSSGCDTRPCLMLGRRWSFVGRGSSGDSVYPYTWAEVFDDPGVAAQGDTNPPPFF